MKDICVVILAAGRGTRMGVNTPKVLLKVGGKSILLRCLNIIKELKPVEIVIVVGYKHEQIKKEVEKSNVKVIYAFQKDLLGTANSLQIALKKIPSSIKNILVIFGDDAAFFRAETIKKFVKFHHKKENKVTFLVSDLNKPNPIGGLEIDNNGKVIGILRQSQLIAKNLNKYPVLVGAFCFDRNWISKNIIKIEKSDLSGEYPLPYIYKVALQEGQPVGTFELKNKYEWSGINTPEELRIANLKEEK